jgi:hypothetical protein
MQRRDAGDRTARIRAFGDFRAKNSGKGTGREGSFFTSAMIGAVYAAENNCCAPSGSNYSAYFTVVPSTRDLASPFDLTGDFTIEWYQNQAVDASLKYPRVFSIGSYETENISIAISLEEGSMIFWINGTPYPTLPQAFVYPPVENLLTHFAIVRQGTIITAYKNGIILGQFIYGDPILANADIFTIRNESTPSTAGQFYGDIPSFHWANTAIYTTETFTPPTMPLVAVPETVFVVNNFPTAGSITANGFTITHYDFVPPLPE